MKPQCPSEMFICFLIFSGITISESEGYELVRVADPVFAVVGGDAILPCSIKPNITIVDMKVEWFRLDQEHSVVVHLYEDHEDRIAEQIQSYRGRTELNPQELQRGNAALKLISVQESDEGVYKCFIHSTSWSIDTNINVKVEAVGSPPVITVDGFNSGGLNLQCESEGWYPEPDLEWLDGKRTRLNPETTETHRNRDGFSVKQTISVGHKDGKIHCRVKLRDHLLETQIVISCNMFKSSKISFIVIAVACIGISIWIIYKYIAHRKLQSQIKIQDGELIHKMYVRTQFKVNVTLDADSAHPRLIVSCDGKQVKDQNIEPEEADVGEFKNDTFTEYLGVIGKEGFSSGCFYYEVQVKGQNVWHVGVARESVNRSESCDLVPQNGFWTVGVKYGKYLFHESSYGSVTLEVNPQRVGVFVDYTKGMVFFYNAESMSIIHFYNGQCFEEKVYPFLCLGYKWNRNSSPLIICDDY